MLQTHLVLPPDTAYCRANLGRSCYQPAQLQKAYALSKLYRRGLDGRGSTIVIVDSFGSPTIRQDLHRFDKDFGLADPPSFRIIQPAGAVPAYPLDPFGVGDRIGWAIETSLDVEWAHAIAPGANILLAETPTSETDGVQGFPEIVAAENYVIDHHLGDVISQSFGSTEETFPNRKALLNLRSAFFNARAHHVTVLAASGDSGTASELANGACCYPFRANSWPSSDPLVTSVGGTQLHLDAAGTRQAPDNVWNDPSGAGGGGRSHVFQRPDFQDGVRKIVGDRRGTPDISMSAATDGAVDVFYSFCDRQETNPRCNPQWLLVGGTSEATPEFAGVIAIADQATGHRIGWLNPTLYRSNKHRHATKAGIVDITTGTNPFAFCSANCGTPTAVDVTIPGFPAKRGYDLSSGLGTINASKFVRALARSHQ